MKKIMAVIFLALFSATVAFASATAAATPVPSKAACKKGHKHCGHKANKPATTTTATVAK